LAQLNSKKGVIQPQLITPAQILEQVKNSQADMPSDLSLPIPTSASYQHLLRMISYDDFLKGQFLVYVIRLPLTNSVLYNLHHVLLLPIEIKGTDSKSLFIQPEHNYLLMDTAKRYFTTLGADELSNCKNVTSSHKLCKQSQPVHLTHLEVECEAQMREPIRSIPATCSKRIVELNHTLWT
jgi:hypothetical protein